MDRYNNSEDAKLTAGTHLSYWAESIQQPIKTSALNKNLVTDVVIVGGGIAGVSIAYCLVGEGKNVVLIEDGFIGSGETSRTTAHLVTALDDRYYHLERVFGEKDTKLIANSHRSAIDFVEQVVKNEKIDCDFERVNGYLFLHPSDDESSIDKELESTMRTGLVVMELKQVPGLLTKEGRCIRFAHQAQFHPLKYLAGLCKAIEAKGGLIFTETHAHDIHSEGIKTDEGYNVTAKHVVIATNTPVNNKYVMHLKQKAYQTYVIGALIKKNVLPKALWWDTGDHDTNETIPPYHYVRLQNYNDEYDLLISGGEDHVTGQADADVIPEENRYAMLESWTRRRFPIEKIVYNWSGEVMEPMDSLAYIGRNPLDKNNVYIVTGDSGNGMTHGTIAGILISDLITEKENKWKKIYSPSRFKLRASSTFFKEFFEEVLSFVRKKPEGKEAVFLSSIQNGEGKVVNLQGEECGVYRDEEGQLHIVSAVCTHLKCAVKWNNDEKSWDCPCHGSRFTYEGNVIHGPANQPLPSFSEVLSK